MTEPIKYIDYRFTVVFSINTSQKGYVTLKKIEEWVEQLGQSFGFFKFISIKMEPLE